MESGGTLIFLGSAASFPVQLGWPVGVTIAPSSSASMALAQAMSDTANPEDVPDFGGPQPAQVQAAQAAAGLAPQAAAVTLNCPGSILRLAVDPSTKVGYGYDTSESIWCESASPFFDVPAGSPATVIASYPNDGQTLLQSGYISGDTLMRGKAAIVDTPLGAGHVVMLAPNVVYRAQTTGSFMFLWNALFEGSRTTAANKASGGK